MMQFYDLDNSGSIAYPEFMKFVLPCDDAQLREDVCQRKTFEVDVKSGKRLHPTVEQGLADFFERELKYPLPIEDLIEIINMS